MFEEMLSLGRSCDSAPRKLLICIDEISKLTDDKNNLWAGDPKKKQRFWRGLYALTRATHPNWIRAVMTGFTDSPRDAIEDSDVKCESLSLSLITDTEQQLLSAELLWAHAIHNVKFP
jgi:hypothetical protein